MSRTVRPKAGTILVVYNRLLPLDEMIATLNVANFLVLQAESEVKALNLAASHANQIDLLMVDVQVTGVCHRFLADTLRQTRPDLQVMLFCGEIVIGSCGCALIQNPFIPTVLMEMINTVLHLSEESKHTRQLSAGSEL